MLLIIADKVVEKGCELIILSDRNYINDKSNFILVDDTVIALGKIAKVYLQSLDRKLLELQVLRVNYYERYFSSTVD